MMLDRALLPLMPGQKAGFGPASSRRSRPGVLVASGPRLTPVVVPIPGHGPGTPRPHGSRTQLPHADRCRCLPMVERLAPGYLIHAGSLPWTGRRTRGWIQRPARLRTRKATMGKIQIPAPRRLRGYLATPTGPGPWPGVVVIHDAVGMTPDLRAFAGPPAAGILREPSITGTKRSTTRRYRAWPPPAQVRAHATDRARCPADDLAGGCVPRQMSLGPSPLR